MYYSRLEPVLDLRSVSPNRRPRKNGAVVNIEAYRDKGLAGRETTQWKMQRKKNENRAQQWQRQDNATQGKESHSTCGGNQWIDRMRCDVHCGQGDENYWRT